MTDMFGAFVALGLLMVAVVCFVIYVARLNKK